MKISTEIGSAANIIGEEKAVELVAKAGFDAFDLTLTSMCKFDWDKKCLIPSSHPFMGNDYLAFARRVKQAGLDNGIVCNQSHAPFPTAVPEIRSFLKRAIECTAEAGGKICIIHPMNKGTTEENAEMYAELLPFAKEHGVKIATENMWIWNDEKDESMFAACATPESFNAHLDAVNDDFFVACLDLGHAEMKGVGTSATEMIYALGNRLKALHIHDNDKWHDSHQIPFTMDINFDPIIKALKDIGYSGYLTLEANRYLSAYTSDNISEGISKMAESAKKFAMMFENK